MLLKSIFNNSNSTQSILIVWCSDLQEAEDLWQKLYLDGWDIDQPIKVKWNWKRFDYLYCFKVSKKLTFDNMKCTGLKAVSYPDTRHLIKGSTAKFGTNTSIFYIVC